LTNRLVRPEPHVQFFGERGVGRGTAEFAQARRVLVIRVEFDGTAAGGLPNFTTAPAFSAAGAGPQHTSARSGGTATRADPRLSRRRGSKSRSSTGAVSGAVGSVKVKRGGSALGPADGLEPTGVPHSRRRGYAAAVRPAGGPDGTLAPKPASDLDRARAFRSADAGPPGSRRGQRAGRQIAPRFRPARRGGIPRPSRETGARSGQRRRCRQRHQVDRARRSPRDDHRTGHRRAASTILGMEGRHNPPASPPGKRPRTSCPSNFWQAGRCECGDRPANVWPSRSTCASPARKTWGASSSGFENPDETSTAGAAFEVHGRTQWDAGATPAEPVVKPKGTRGSSSEAWARERLVDVVSCRAAKCGARNLGRSPLGRPLR